MAQQWNVPPDTSQKEKIVGGLLTAGQLVWMILGLGIAALLAVILVPVMKIVGLVVALVIGIGFGVFFCFYKKHDIPIFTYLRLKRKHATKTSKLPNKQTKKIMEENDIW